ncbi:MAG: flagellar assembly factor FliW [Oscillospiraceae bacterium]|nr:flagellar assembly factor FliW [Oscillospiraceae bacterium]
MEQEAKEKNSESFLNTDILYFKEGILGFETIKEYALLFTEDDVPFFYLQAVGETHPCFIVCDPVRFLPEYRVNYNAEILEQLEAETSDDLKCLTIVTIPSNVSDTTVNLKSPVIFNINNNYAKQFVLDVPEYSIRHNLFGNSEAVG